GGAGAPRRLLCAPGGRELLCSADRELLCRARLLHAGRPGRLLLLAARSLLFSTRGLLLRAPPGLLLFPACRGSPRDDGDLSRHLAVALLFGDDLRRRPRGQLLQPGLPLPVESSIEDGGLRMEYRRSRIVNSLGLNVRITIFDPRSSILDPR